jgi:hypothetical protein
VTWAPAVANKIVCFQDGGLIAVGDAVHDSGQGVGVYEWPVHLQKLTDQ